MCLFAVPKCLSVKVCVCFVVFNAGLLMPVLSAIIPLKVMG